MLAAWPIILHVVTSDVSEQFRPLLSAFSGTIYDPGGYFQQPGVRVWIKRGQMDVKL
jgi:hypothetical protein